MVVGIDYNPKSIEPKNCWHEVYIIIIPNG